MTPLVRRATIVLALSSVACSTTSSDALPPGFGEHQQRLALDSMLLRQSSDTVFRRRLADLVRRSLLVPLDSTVRLLTSVPTTPDSLLHHTRQALGCQSMQLITTHGSAAYQRAYARVMDSLMRTGFPYDDLMARVENAPGAQLAFNGPDACGINRSAPPLPDSLDSEVLPNE